MTFWNVRCSGENQETVQDPLWQLHLQCVDVIHADVANRKWRVIGCLPEPRGTAPKILPGELGQAHHHFQLSVSYLDTKQCRLAVHH